MPVRALACLSTRVPGSQSPPFDRDSGTERPEVSKVKLRMNRTRTRWIALVWLLLCCGISVFGGYSLQRASPDGMGDFKGVYYAARCLIQHGDPYESGPLRVYQAEAGDRSRPSAVLHQILTRYIYLPTASIFIVPFAMLPWGPAHALWMILTAGSLILAAFLMWNLGANCAPAISGGLICFILANGEALFATGNTAGIVVSFCVVAVWCFLEERLVPAGIVCLAVSLSIKPHDAGLVWLYFLLAGGVYRKRALQTLALTVALGLPSVLWVSHVAPHWVQELHSNILEDSLRGGPSDPGLGDAGRTGPSMIINLQSAISVFRDDPRIYNPASYLVCGALLLVWWVRTLRSRRSKTGAWLALAAIVPLTLLATYHGPYDAKLLLLAVPACAMLWTKGGPIRWLALLATAAGIVFTADIPLTILLILTKDLRISTAGLSGQILTVVLMRPTSLILLAMGIFYLCVYVRHDPDQVEPGKSGELSETPLAPTLA